MNCGVVRKAVEPYLLGGGKNSTLFCGKACVQHSEMLYVMNVGRSTFREFIEKHYETKGRGFRKIVK